MGFLRAQFRGTGLVRDGRPGDGWSTHLAEAVVATDADTTITVAQINTGLIVRNGMTAARNGTTDTAANILAANPEMDIGESFLFAITVTTAFALTLVGGVGVTLVGNSAVPANGFRMYTLTRTGAATVTIRGL